ncbi:MAG: transcription antitermination factor NusB [Planctomycetes bacterium]|nr:transcription antitermination factor NusB [Planctomycetota bacterium]MBL7008925.1 transcription antitermination factor NusB [Planctomycetota bacterium]
MAAPVRRRTRARELALQFLYTLELRGLEALGEVGEFVDHHTKRSPDSKGKPEVREYAIRLVHGVEERRDELNTWIERIAANWRLERMAHIDRNVLRLAVYELLYVPEVPFKVVINEAIDIAKRFSTSQSGSFVNGILDRARVLIESQRADGAEHPVPPDPSAGPAGSAASSSVDLLRQPPAPTPRPRARRARPDAAPARAASPLPDPGALGDSDAPSAGEDFPLPDQY